MSRQRKGKVKITRYQYEKRADAKYQLGGKKKLFRVGSSHYGIASRGETRRLAKKRYYKSGSYINGLGETVGEQGKKPKHLRPGLIPVRGIR